MFRLNTIGVCVPAVIYFVLSVLQIVFDMGNFMVYTVIAKIVITLIFTSFLCTLCVRGLGKLAWFFVIGIPLLMLIATPSTTDSKGKKKKQTGLHEAFSWPSVKFPSINVATPLVKMPAMSVSVDGGDWQFPIPTAVSLGCLGQC
jgi:hypothetical protein